MNPSRDEIARRRTFAIISHPDAGKTTITEKLLLYGGALHSAGSVKARKTDRHAVSDWMQMEQDRGISITSTVLQFSYGSHRFNLVDTPGHADFSEDTFRTLSAVDSAVVLLDSMKGVEERTRRLFEVCRFRRMPLITFVNKLDRHGRDPFDLLQEVSSTFGVGVTPLTWPIGDGPGFRGVVDTRTRLAHLYRKVEHGSTVVPERILPLGDPELVAELGEARHGGILEDLELLSAGEQWDPEAFMAGELTPFLFGSAMTNFGVAPLLRVIVEVAPPPGPRPLVEGERSPVDPGFAGFVFKVQANMNPRHRDRIAFVRVVSGTFQRGMEVRLARTGQIIRMSKPQSVMATERELVDEAFPGDIVGLFDPIGLRIGDTLTAVDDVEFAGIPRFAPGHFARIHLKDPTRRKHLQKGLDQLSQEGAIQVFKREPGDPVDPMLGAVGLLQFEVLQARLQQEYNVAVDLAPASFTVARWIEGDDEAIVWFRRRSDYMLLWDRDARPVVLAQSAWSLNYAVTQFPALRLHDISQEA